MTNDNIPGRGFFIFLGCCGIYIVIDTIIETIDLVLNTIFR